MSLRFTLVSLVAAAMLYAAVSSEARGLEEADSAAPQRGVVVASPTSIPFAQPVVFIITEGENAPVRAAISNALALRLQGKWRDIWVVPEPQWTFATYTAQCAQEATTQGAFIALPATVSTGTTDRFLYRKTRTQVMFDVLFADCIGKKPRVVWNAGIGYAISKPSVAYTFISPLLGAVALYTAFAPAKTFQTAQTVIYPATNPPASGLRSQVVTTTSSSVNSGGTGSLVSGALSAATNYTQNLTGLQNSEGLLLDASFRAADSIKARIDDCKNEAPPKPSFCNWPTK
jgi:hypothetical protein